MPALESPNIEAGESSGVLVRGLQVSEIDVRSWEEVGGLGGRTSATDIMTGRIKQDYRKPDIFGNDGKYAGRNAVKSLQTITDWLARSE